MGSGVIRSAALVMGMKKHCLLTLGWGSFCGASARPYTFSEEHVLLNIFLRKMWWLNPYKSQRKYPLFLVSKGTPLTNLTSILTRNKVLYMTVLLLNF